MLNTFLNVYTYIYYIGAIMRNPMCFLSEVHASWIRVIINYYSRWKPIAINAQLNVTSIVRPTHIQTHFCCNSTHFKTQCLMSATRNRNSCACDRPLSTMGSIVVQFACRTCTTGPFDWRRKIARTACNPHAHALVYVRELARSLLYVWWTPSCAKQPSSVHRRH